MLTAVMRTVEPPFPAYRRTVEALKTYMKLAREDDGELLPLPAKPVKPGNAYSGVPRLKGFLLSWEICPRPRQAEAPDLVYRGLW